MYNESSPKDRLLYNVENDSYANYLADECLKKYKDMDIDKSSICYVIYLSGSKEMSSLQILIVNKDKNKEEMYTIFS